MKYDLIVCDAPFSFKDKLKHSKVKRGAESQYKSILSDNDILNLDIGSLAADNCLLAFWVPSSYLQFGLDCLKKYGFKQKQSWVWVKTKKNPLTNLIKQIFKSIKKITDFKSFKKQTIEIINSFNINEILSFFMGHYFRQTHEIVLIGVRGKMASKIKNKAQRSVFLGPIGKHSEKPEALQDMLELMFPESNKLEMFARRQRKGWITVGNECVGPSLNEDIRDSIKRLISE